MSFDDFFGLGASETGFPPQVLITPENVRGIFAEDRPRQIHFPTSHAGALKRKAGAQGRGIGTFSVPFYDSVGPLFEAETDLELFHSKQYGNYWRYIETEAEFSSISRCIERQGSRVFIRDTLAMSLALDFNLKSKTERTAVGNLEYLAKYDRNRRAVQKLVGFASSAIQQLQFYQGAGVIAAVPPKEGKDFDLPTTLASTIADSLGIADVTGGFEWKGDKGSLKDIAVEDKWQRLEKASLIHEGYDISDKEVILVDDLYQSGITMQYVAMTLQKAGAKQIYGLSLVKSWRLTDNR